MQNHDQAESRRGRLYSPEESGAIVLTLIFLAIIGGVFYVAAARYHLRISQLVEAGLYLISLLGAGGVIIHYLWTYNQKLEQAWPHVPARLSPLRDHAHVQKASAGNAIVLGYDVHRRPWLWPDEVRRMQAILLGAPGSGKTSLLRNIIVQDIHRTVGGRDNPRRIPMIIFDGKADGAFLESLLFELAAAGRSHQLRVLDPARPHISARYNPLYLREDDAYQEHVNFVFESFALRDDFFKFHQANYFSDLVRVLVHTGKRFNIHDVLVLALDERVLQEQIAEASQRIERRGGVFLQEKLNFRMSVKNLQQSLQDRERVAKIQGLLNELMTFLDDQLSIITGPYDNLLTLDQVIDQELILFVSLNTNRNTRAVTALGRMLLQNLQLLVGKRYERNRENAPMVSIVLDEFAPFAYPNFAQVLQTARGSNVSFLFSLQSIAQLESVSLSFRNNVTSAPNTIMVMKTWDEETARYFQNAASEVAAERKTERVERRNPFSADYQRTGFGSVTEAKEARVPEEHIKNLPIGQMQILMTDHRMGAPRCSHLHARRVPEFHPEFFQPAIYPPLDPAESPAPGAHLRFKDLSLMRRFARISGRKNPGEGYDTVA